MVVVRRLAPPTQHICFLSVMATVCSGVRVIMMVGDTGAGLYLGHCAAHHDHVPLAAQLPAALRVQAGLAHLHTSG